MKTKDRLKSIHSKIRLDENGCWNWIGGSDSKGYGQIGFKSGKKRVHRLMYQWFVGPIKEKNHVHHKCRNIKCINPEHLESLTAGNHLSARRNTDNQNVGKTHCKHGHEFTPENTVIIRTGKLLNKVWRGCKSCRQECARKHRKKEFK